MTARQVCYQLVSRQVIVNNRSPFQAMSNDPIETRKDGMIPWEWIEDRLRRPRAVTKWVDLVDFADTVRRAYQSDVWAIQKHLVKVWLEKDALSGIFDDVLRHYGVTLNVGCGYNGSGSIHSAAVRYQKWGGQVTILYYEDFDPSCEDMVRFLRVRLGELYTMPEIMKCALTKGDKGLSLAPDFPKATDTWQEVFMASWGEVAVDLETLPIDVLQKRLEWELG